MRTPLSRLWSSHPDVPSRCTIPMYCKPPVSDRVMWFDALGRNLCAQATASAIRFQPPQKQIFNTSIVTLNLNLPRFTAKTTRYSLQKFRSTQEPVEGQYKGL